MALILASLLSPESGIDAYAVTPFAAFMQFWLLHLFAYSLLVPPMGVMGATWGNAAAMISGSVIAVVIVLRRLSKISPQHFPQTGE